MTPRAPLLPWRPLRAIPASPVGEAGGDAGAELIVLPAAPDGVLMTLGGAPVAPALPPAPSRPVIALAPPAAVTLRWQAVPPLPPVQRAAAAVALSEGEGLAAPASLHCVAAAPEAPAAADAPVPVATVAHDLMTRWLALADAQGLDVLAIVPAALAVHPPAPGEWMRVPLADAAFLRGRAAAVPDEPALVAALVGVAPVRPGAVAPALARAVPLDLRAGPHVRREPVRPLRWRLLARVLLGAGLLVTAGQAVVIHRMHRAAQGADAAALGALGQVLDPVPPLDAGEAALAAERARLGGAGGQLGTAALLYAALGRHSTVTLQSLGWDAGRVKASVAAPSLEALNALLVDLQASGFRGRLAVAPGAGGTAATLTLESAG